MFGGHLWSNLDLTKIVFFVNLVQINKFKALLSKSVSTCLNPCNKTKHLVHVPNFGGLSGSEDRGGGDNSIQLINFGRVGDKSFEEWRQKIGGWKGG